MLIHIRLRHLPNIDRWELLSGDRATLLETDQVRELVERVLAQPVTDTNTVQLGPVIAEGVSRAQLTRVKDYLSMFQEYLDRLVHQE